MNYQSKESCQNIEDVVDGADSQPRCAVAAGSAIRRDRIDQFTPAEKAIWDAVKMIDAMPPHPWLTDSINLLHAARRRVADYVDVGGGKCTHPRKYQFEGEQYCWVCRELMPDLPNGKAETRAP